METKETNYRIIQLHGENFKRLKVVDITPDPDSVIIAGPNEQGKSSILDAIQAALAGKDSLKDIPEPIRKGQDKAEIKIDLGEFIVTRTFTKKDSYLKVTSHEGASYKNPQSILNNLFNKATIDPSVFLSMDEAGQSRTLKAIVKMAVDVDGLEEERKAKYEERTTANKEVQNLQARFNAMPHPEQGLPAEEKPASEIVSKIRESNTVIFRNNEKRTQLKEMGKEFCRLKKRKAALQKELDEVDKEIVVISDAGKKLQTEVEALIDPDPDRLTIELANIDLINKRIRYAKEFNQLNQQLIELKHTSEKLTAEINELAEKKRTALEEAEFPIEGLGFGENGITFKGIPFTQCSQEERIKAALAIAMAQNPRLKVILIREATLFDRRNLELIQQLARARGYQLWLEKVSDDDKECGIIIQDGKIANNN